MNFDTSSSDTLEDLVDPFRLKSKLSTSRRARLISQWEACNVNAQVLPFAADFDLSLMYLFLKTGYTFTDTQYMLIIGLDVSNSQHMEAFDHLLHHLSLAAKHLHILFPRVPLAALPLNQVWNLIYSISICYRGIFYIPVLDSGGPVQYTARFNNLWVLVSMFNRQYELLTPIPFCRRHYHDEIINATHSDPLL